MPYIWSERQKGKMEYRQSLTLHVWIRRFSLMHSNRRQLTTLRAKWSDIVDGLWWYRVVSFSFSSSSVQMWFCWRPVWSPKTWPNGFKWDNGGGEKNGSWITAVTLWVQWCTYSALLAFDWKMLTSPFTSLVSGFALRVLSLVARGCGEVVRRKCTEFVSPWLSEKDLTEHKAGRMDWIFLVAMLCLNKFWMLRR